MPGPQLTSNTLPPTLVGLAIALLNLPRTAAAAALQCICMLIRISMCSMKSWPWNVILDDAHKELLPIHAGQAIIVTNAKCMSAEFSAMCCAAHHMMLHTGASIGLVQPRVCSVVCQQALQSRQHCKSYLQGGVHQTHLQNRRWHRICCSNSTLSTE